MRKPNLFIAGAQKSGSSSLYQMLKVHPSIFMAQNKELNFFNAPKFTPAATEAYWQNFAEAEDEAYVGEATPHYFSSNREDPTKSAAAKRISNLVGTDIRIILILRNPIERALAGWRHNYVYGRFDASVSPFSAPPSQGVIHLSHYRWHWDAWHAYFPDSAFHVCLFDDLKQQPRQMLGDLLRWLGLPMEHAVYDGFPFARRVNSLESNQKRLNMPTLPPIERALIQQLHDCFEEDIAFVRRVTGRALSQWSDVDAIYAKYKSAE